MKLSTLKNKLSKLNSEYSILDYNDYNKAIYFTLNGKKYSARFTSKDEKIYNYDFMRKFGYDDANQQSFSSVYKNFNAVLKDSKL